MTLGTKAIVVGAVANLFLSLIKFIGGVFGNSIALVADAFHSLSDLITDVVVYFSHGAGHIPPDNNHPYGHGRAETIGTTVVGLLIIVTGLGVIFEAWDMMTQNITSPQLKTTVNRGPGSLSSL